MERPASHFETYICKNSRFYRDLWVSFHLFVFFRFLKEEILRTCHHFVLQSQVVLALSVFGLRLNAFRDIFIYLIIHR